MGEAALAAVTVVGESAVARQPLSGLTDVQYVQNSPPPDLRAFLTVRVRA